MQAQRNRTTRSSASSVLLAIACATGLAWIVATALLQNIQRQIDEADPSSVNAAIESTRSVQVIGYVAMPAFFVSVGTYVVVWALRSGYR